MNNYYYIKNFNYSSKNDQYELYNINLKIEKGRRYLIESTKQLDKTLLLKILGGEINKNDYIFKELLIKDTVYINNKNYKMKYKINQYQKLSIIEYCKKKLDKNELHIKNLLKNFDINFNKKINKLSNEEKNLIKLVLTFELNYKIICLENIFIDFEENKIKKILNYLFLESQTKKRTIFISINKEINLENWATNFIFLSYGQIKYDKKINKILSFTKNLNEFIKNKKKIYNRTRCNTYVKINRKRKINEIYEKDNNLNT